jgi:hypothetical protein
MKELIFCVSVIALLVFCIVGEMNDRQSQPIVEKYCCCDSTKIIMLEPDTIVKIKTIIKHDTIFVGTLE